MRARIMPPDSLFAEEQPDNCPIQLRHKGPWRVVFCNGDTDVLECASCGKQREANCNFDEDCS